MAPPGKVFRREGEGLEFDRFAFFSDAIYAIAMTISAVGIGAAALDDTGSSRDFFDGLSDKSSEIISFFVSFAVLGFFWTAHHRFVSLLAGMDARLRTWNLVYLAFVAFLPFPTVLLGVYDDNSAAVAFYAISVGTISALETVMLRHAHRAGLYKKPMPESVANYQTAASLIPVVCFGLSIPLAFVSPMLGFAAWILGIPAQMVLARFKPEGADQYFE